MQAEHSCSGGPIALGGEKGPSNNFRSGNVESVTIGQLITGR